MPDYRNRRRVVVTGMGALSPLGNTVDEMWTRAIAGESGVQRLTLVDPSNYPCQVGGEVRDWDPSVYMDRKDARRMGRFAQFAVGAARQALDASGLDLASVDRERIGAILGNGGAGLPETDATMRTILERGGSKVDPFYVAKFLGNMAAGNVTIQLGLLGYSNTVTTACAAGTQAIGDATEVIRRGAADVMFAGGAEAGISELGLASFCAMRALTTGHNDDPEHASRPFDRDRDGFAPAEGSGVLMLEALEHAIARGAEPLAEIIGYGVSADARYLVAPPADGEGAARAMRFALNNAGVGIDEIDYISAHATATDIGDLAETRAVRTIFGERAYQVPLSSFKSQVGHLLGAAGGVEAVMAVQTIRNGMLAPTLNLEHPGEDCDLDYVANVARAAEVRTVMKDSFGFGGQNAVLIFRRYEP